MAITCIPAMRCARDPDEADQPPKDMSFLERHADDDLYTKAIKSLYFPFLLRFHRSGLFLWLAVFVVSIVFGPQFLGLTKSDLDVPAGTSSAKATKALNQNYPEISTLVNILKEMDLHYEVLFFHI